MLRMLSLFILTGVFHRVEAQTSTLALADSLFSVGDYQKAIQVYEVQENISANVYQKIALAQKAGGNLNAALAAYQQAIQQNSNLVVAKANYGKLLRRTFQYQKADSVYTDLLKHYPNQANFYYELALIRKASKAKPYDKLLLQSIKINPSYFNSLYELALFYYKRKNFKEADIFINKALRLIPKNTKGLLLAGLSAYALQNTKRAIVLFESLIESGYQTEQVYEKLGVCYARHKQNQKAIDCFKKLIALDDKNATAHIYMGRLYNIEESYTLAEKHLLYALLLSKPDLSSLYQSLGITYKQQRNYKEALRYFELATLENPDLVRSGFELANAADNYYADLELRIKYYNIFIEKYKNKPDVQKWLNLAKYRISDLKKEKHYKQTPDNKP
ncbi:lipopolysaccharide assembly protein LapB [Mesonia sp. HuA40]|uniref:tetratricopeptide repeat protein n=1 Tax=Mesonia sp. HuA40 TaxID=2602761 RepID=UPI0011CBF2E6|nr:tetratricopeptide repeat protein [Mesonia sp. HuA40]TXK75359.1 tetratricopeptide repeat protein [Mesonia sp. HuA40]